MLLIRLLRQSSLTSTSPASLIRSSCIPSRSINSGVSSSSILLQKQPPSQQPPSQQQPHQFNFSSLPPSEAISKLNSLHTQLTPDQLSQLKIQAMRPYRLRNALIGGSLFAFVAGIFAYSLYATKTESFEEIPESLKEAVEKELEAEEAAKRASSSSKK